MFHLLHNTSVSATGPILFMKHWSGVVDQFRNVNTVCCFHWWSITHWINSLDWDKPTTETGNKGNVRVSFLLGIVVPMSSAFAATACKHRGAICWLVTRQVSPHLLVWTEIQETFQTCCYQLFHMPWNRLGLTTLSYTEPWENPLCTISLCKGGWNRSKIWTYGSMEQNWKYFIKYRRNRKKASPDVKEQLTTNHLYK